MQKYDYRNCQSLFGYGRAVHVRSKFVCQLCGCDASSPPNYDLFRQLTVEHLIGESQGGYLPAIRLAVAERFSQLATCEQEALARTIHDANCVTACHFCNSMTSRKQHNQSIPELLAADGTPDEILASVVAALTGILAHKKSEIAVKNQSVRDAFDAEILPAMDAKDTP